MAAVLTLDHISLKGRRVKRRKGLLTIVAVSYDGANGIPEMPAALPAIPFRKPFRQSWNATDSFRLLIQSWADKPSQVGWIIHYVVLGRGEQAKAVIEAASGAVGQIPVIGDIGQAALSIGAAIAGIVGRDRIVGTDIQTLVGGELDSDYTSTSNLWGVESTVSYDVVEPAEIAYAKSLQLPSADKSVDAMLALDFDEADDDVPTNVIWIKT